MSASSTPSTSHTASPALAPAPSFPSIVSLLIDQQKWRDLLSTAEHRELQVQHCFHSMPPPALSPCYLLTSFLPPLVFPLAGLRRPGTRR